MTKGLLTIKEVAQRAGVSTQAIYQRLDKDLKPYLQAVIDALREQLSQKDKQIETL